MNSNQDYGLEPLESGRKSFNIKLFFASVKSNWFWLVLSIVIFMVAAFFYLRYTTPIYATAAQILIQNDKGAGSEASVLSELSGFSTGARGIENDVMVLQAKQLMQTVVSDLTANIIYLRKGDVLDVELYDPPFEIKLLQDAEITKAVTINLTFSGNDIEIFSETFSKKVKVYEPFLLPGVGKVQLERLPNVTEISGDYIVNMTTVVAKASQLKSKLTVSAPVKGLSVLNLGITGAVPAKSEDIINKLIANYISTTQLDKSMIADSTIAFIENRLVYVGQELGDIEGDVEVFKKQNKLTDITSQASQLVTASNQYSQELAEIETQLSILDAIRSYLVKEGSDKRVLPSGALIADPTFNALVGRYNALVQERERTGLSQTVDNPYYKNLTDQIAGVRADILRNFENTRNTLNITRNRLRNRAAVVEGQVRDVPTIERTFVDMSRQREIKQQIYTYLLQKREEIGISTTMDVTNCKIIERPSSSGPISPKRVMIFSIAFFLGLVLPLLVIYLQGALNTKVSTKDDVLDNTHIPVIAEISSNKDSETNIVYKNPKSPIAEQFRSLRANMVFFLKSDEKTILITSSMLGEGKSFVSLNLATMLAMSGKKVLMMELDLRKPNLSNKLNIKSSPGITGYLTSSELTANQIIQKSGIHDDLFIMSSGVIPPNPAEIILKPKMDQLMAQIAAQFDYIIIDAPPAGQVADAQILSKYADLTLYLVRQRYTQIDHLKIAEDLYINHKMKNMALVINDISLNPAHGYQNAYGYGYGEEPKKNFIKSIFGG